MADRTKLRRYVKSNVLSSGPISRRLVGLYNESLVVNETYADIAVKDRWGQVFLLPARGGCACGSPRVTMHFRWTTESRQIKDRYQDGDKEISYQTITVSKASLDEGPVYVEELDYLIGYAEFAEQMCHPSQYSPLDQAVDHILEELRSDQHAVRSTIYVADYTHALPDFALPDVLHLYIFGGYCQVQVKKIGDGLNTHKVPELTIVSPAGQRSIPLDKLVGDQCQKLIFGCTAFFIGIDQFRLMQFVDACLELDRKRMTPEEYDKFLREQTRKHEEELNQRDAKHKETVAQLKAEHEQTVKSLDSIIKDLKLQLAEQTRKATQAEAETDRMRGILNAESKAKEEQDKTRRAKIANATEALKFWSTVLKIGVPILLSLGGILVAYVSRAKANA